jgi:hypothetical protein
VSTARCSVARKAIDSSVYSCAAPSGRAAGRHSVAQGRAVRHVPTLLHLRRDWAHPPATPARGLGSPRPHLHRDWAHPAHICTGTKLTPAHICAGTGPGFHTHTRAQTLACRLTPTPSHTHAHSRALARAHADALPSNISKLNEIGGEIESLSADIDASKVLVITLRLLSTTSPR